MKTQLRKRAAILLLIPITFIEASVLQQTHHEEDEGELVFTSIHYRHGIRTPTSFSPKDPYRNMSYWPEGLGMLTNLGKLQHFEHGRWLRRRYERLIPDGKYSQEVVYIQSTDYDRTLMSAESNLAGMFYPTKEEMWGPLEWQPIPVHTIPEELDKLLSVKYPCPKIVQQRRFVEHSPVVKIFNKEHKETYKYLSKNAGMKIMDPGRASTLYITQLIEKLHNYTLPKWTENVSPEELRSISGFSFQMRTMTKWLKRLKGGPLLKDIITHMKQKRSGTLHPNRNIWVYSGHDTTVAAMLSAMGVFDPHPPPFAATVMVELRKTNQGNYFVSVHYKNTTEEPQLLTIPGCSPSCPLDKFEALLNDVIPKNWEQECYDLSSGDEDELNDDLRLKGSSMGTEEEYQENYGSKLNNK